MWAWSDVSEVMFMKIKKKGEKDPKLGRKQKRFHRNIAYMKQQMEIELWNSALGETKQIYLNASSFYFS